MSILNRLGLRSEKGTVAVPTRPTNPLDTVLRHAEEIADATGYEVDYAAFDEARAFMEQPVSQEGGSVFTTPAGRRFHADVVDELFDAVECANKAETHQHRRFHVRRAARILAESDREFNIGDGRDGPK